MFQIFEFEHGASFRTGVRPGFTAFAAAVAARGSDVDVRLGRYVRLGESSTYLGNGFVSIGTQPPPT